MPRKIQPSYAVAVTGGSGYLGQHLVKLLQTKADYVSEIRVIDKTPYTNKLGYLFGICHDETKPVQYFCGDITEIDDLRHTFRGVKTVFHLASVVSVGTFPDLEGMETINVTGTAQVIAACVLEGVDHLIYCSTVDVVVGMDNIINGTESTTLAPQKYMYEGYGRTKSKAESMVLTANGKRLAKGSNLKTVSLRPCVLFGEEDQQAITVCLQKAKKSGGTLFQINSDDSLYQQAYVGNVAWAFVCADKALGDNVDVAGEAFFITDDFPVKPFSEQIQPFLQEHGFTLSRHKLPCWMVYGLVVLIEIVLQMISFIIKFDIGISSRSIWFITRKLYFSSKKARSMLQYSPLFSPEESIKMANTYYNKLSL